MIAQYNKLDGFVVLRNIQDNQINVDDIEVVLIRYININQNITQK